VGTELSSLIGVQNGFNVNFSTLTPYAPNTLVVRKNGVNLNPSTDFSQTGPASGQLALTVPPIISDVLIAAYQDPPVFPPAATTGPQAVFTSQLRALSAQGGNDLTIVAGQSGPLIQFQVFDASGDPFLLTGSTLYFAANQDSESGQIVFNKSSKGGGIVVLDQIVPANLGVAQVVFTTAETLGAAGMILTWMLYAKDPTGNVTNLVVDARLTMRAGLLSVFP
jgi:hypothetical protein